MKLYKIIQHSDKFYIQLGTVIPIWQTGFSCIECAESFAQTHDLSTATSNYIRYSPDDFEWVISFYRFEPAGRNTWEASNGYMTFRLIPEHDIELQVFDETRHQIDTVHGMNEVLLTLDKAFPDILACNKLLNKSAKEYIKSASNAKELASKLVRVKSSNVWAYGMNIKDKKDKTGDLLIQFKGRNGGPGDIYMYYNVPVMVWRKFITATSKGHFFWVMIRNNFTYRKLTGDKRTHLKNGVN